jgi:hypothetical protein
MNIIPARYTEVLVNLLNNAEAKAKIDKAMSTYPLYKKQSKEEYIPSYIPTREELNNAILNYYKYREIGFETFGRFLEELETALKEIMPYYNQLYFSTDQDYDLLFNVDYTRDITRARQDVSNGTQTNETTSTATDQTTTTSSVNNYSKNVNSQTPQGSLNITAQGIDNVTYADNVSWNHNTSNDTATSNGTANTTASGSSENNDTHNEDETTSERVKGNYGQMSYQTLLGQYRDLIMNVTQQIINDERISELFMLIY